MARHWVPETTPDPRRATWSTTPLPDVVDEHLAEVHPIVPAARMPAPAEVDAHEAATA